ncbi:hypothetical protein RJT34_20265 [Clitoria ternatea]|uniref:DEAD-box ATP-dependent RNA helicase 48 n=1 Tax=Clitoria ternatea TaxID=43366 RepID=A0AAN9ISJ2_CLITE
MNLLVPNLPQQLSFTKSLLSTSECHFLHNPTKKLHFLTHSPSSNVNTIIRMGGGPRTYPGGVSKWQWKRMQARKAKQLLKARLSRERQIYEMRKRAELKAAVSELERPWEVVEKAPNLFSVGADEQVKVLADRFQRPGGFDLWNEKDGPQLFQTPDELPSARFFPKGVVHSIKPYRKVDGYGLLKGTDDDDVVEGDVVSEGVDQSSDRECSSSLSYGRKGIDFDGGLNGKENGMRFLLEDVGGFDSEDGPNEEECSSPLSSRRSGRGNFDGRLRRNGNGQRSLSEDVGWSNNGERSSRLNYGRNGLNGGGRMKKIGNGNMNVSKGVEGADGGGQFPSLSSGRNRASFNGRMRNKGSGRGILSRDVGRYDDGRLRGRENGRRLDDGRLGGKENGRRLDDGRLGGRENGRRHDDGRLRGRENGRRHDDGRLRGRENGRFMSKDVDESNGMYSGGVGSVRKQRGSNSFAGRSRGIYTSRTSDHASPSPRGRDTNSEVYDMGLQQDGSYGFVKKNQSDSSSC